MLIQKNKGCTYVHPLFFIEAIYLMIIKTAFVLLVAGINMQFYLHPFLPIH